MSNARIQFSTASEEKWLQVNPVLREGELVIARKANGKRKLVVGKPGGFGLRNYWAGSVYNALKKQGKYLTK